VSSLELRFMSSPYACGARAFYLLLYILGGVWREAFRFLLNAQFFGADVASLLPHDLTTSVFVGTLLVLIVVVRI